MNDMQYLRTLARYDRDIKEGNIAFNYRTGECTAVPGAVLKSWGPGCPTGGCQAKDLPAALNRYFAGDRAGCKEMPYNFNFTSTRGVTDEDVTVEVTSKVTMCPTRVLGIADLADEWLVKSIQFGNQNELVGDPFPIEALDPGAFQPVPLVPDCIEAGTPITITLTRLGSAGEGTAHASITFIGPMVG